MPVLLSYFSLPLVLPRPVALKISDEISGLQIKNSENLKVLVDLYLPQVRPLLNCDIRSATNFSVLFVLKHLSIRQNQARIGPALRTSQVKKPEG